MRRLPSGASAACGSPWAGGRHAHVSKPSTLPSSKPSISTSSLLSNGRTAAAAAKSSRPSRPRSSNGEIGSGLDLSESSLSSKSTAAAAAAANDRCQLIGGASAAAAAACKSSTAAAPAALICNSKSPGSSRTAVEP